MHRASGLTSRRAFLLLAPLAVLAVVGLVFGRSLGSSDSAQVSAPYTATSAAATTAPSAAATTAAAAALPSLGVKKGSVTLAGPAKVAKGSHVLFVLDGPKRVLTTDKKAPFALTLKTRTLPNGTYTLTSVVLRDGTRSAVTTSTLRIKNTKPKAKKPKPESSKTATPTPTKSKSGGGNGGGSGDGSGSGDGDAAAPPASGSGFASAVLSLANTERNKAGCDPLTLDSELNDAAQGHSEDMATNNYFSHDSQDGRSPFDRIKAAGYSFGAAAENIAAGSTTAAGAMDQWMNSAGHKANILNCTYTELGVGYAKGSGADYAGYWTQNFGKPL